MSSPWYDRGAIVPRTRATAEQMNNELAKIEAALDQLPAPDALFGDITGTASAATRSALAALSSASSPAYLREEGREGWFVWTAGDYSSNVTADPGQGIYVPPTSHPTGSSGTWKRVYDPGFYFGSWWGATGDGSTDDTVAIQRGWTWVSTNGGGRIKYRKGTYAIAGALQDISLSNARLVLPKITTFTGVVTLILEGCGVPHTSDALGGTIFESSLTSAGNMIGVKASGSSGPAAAGITQLSLICEDICFRVPKSSDMTALNLGYVPWNRLTNVRVDVPDMFDADGKFDLAEPTSATHRGIYTPRNNISARTHFDGVVVAGYTVGVIMSELCSGNLTVSACAQPILTQDGAHPSSLDYVLITNSPRAIYSQGFLELNIQMLDIEHSDASAQGPAWITPFDPDIDDPDNALRGRIYYHKHGASGYLDLTRTGCKYVQLDQVDLITAGLQTFVPIFTGFNAAINRSSLIETRARHGASYAWHSLMNSQASSSGTIGGISFSNTNLAGPEYRLGQMAVACDGDLDRGKFGWVTFKAGVAKDAFQINCDGYLVSPTMPAAADDAAAAALSPAVPVGGFYHASGALRIRRS